MEVSTLRMAWVPEARLQEALTEGLFVCIEEGTSKHATSHDDDVGDQTREGRAHHGNCLLFTGSSHDRRLWGVGQTERQTLSSLLPPT